MVPKGREAIVATQKWMSRSVPARSVVVVTELVMATPLTLATVLPGTPLLDSSLLSC